MKNVLLMMSVMTLALLMTGCSRNESGNTSRIETEWNKIDPEYDAWTQIEDLKSYHEMKVIESDDHEEVLYGAGGGQGLWVSTDYGQTWVLRARDLETTITDIKLYDGDLLIGTNDGRLLKSKDRGQSWETLAPKTNPESDTQIAVIPGSQEESYKLLVSRINLHLWDGSKWSIIDDDLRYTVTRRRFARPDTQEYQFTSVRPAVNPHNQRHLVVGTQHGFVAVSEDQGASWKNAKMELKNGKRHGFEDKYKGTKTFGTSKSVYGYEIKFSKKDPSKLISLASNGLFMQTKDNRYLFKEIPLSFCGDYDEISIKKDWDFDNEGSIALHEGQLFLAIKSIAVSDNPGASRSKCRGIYVSSDWGDSWHLLSKRDDSSGFYIPRSSVYDIEVLDRNRILVASIHGLFMGDLKR